MSLSFFNPNTNQTRRAPANADSIQLKGHPPTPTPPRNSRLPPRHPLPPLGHQVPQAPAVPRHDLLARPRYSPLRVLFHPTTRRREHRLYILRRPALGATQRAAEPASSWRRVAMAGAQERSQVHDHGYAHRSHPCHRTWCCGSGFERFPDLDRVSGLAAPCHTAEFLRMGSGSKIMSKRAIVGGRLCIIEVVDAVLAGEPRFVCLIRSCSQPR